VQAPPSCDSCKQEVEVTAPFEDEDELGEESYAGPVSAGPALEPDERLVVGVEDALEVDPDPADKLPAP